MRPSGRAGDVVSLTNLLDARVVLLVEKRFLSQESEVWSPEHEVKECRAEANAFFRLKAPDFGLLTV